MKSKRKALPSGQKYDIENLGHVEMSKEHTANVSKAIELAEKEDAECRINFRWQKDPVAIVKKAAELSKLPYQAYIKKVVLEQAIRELQSEKYSSSMKTDRVSEADLSGLQYSVNSAGTGSLDDFFEQLQIFISNYQIRSASQTLSLQLKNENAKSSKIEKKSK